MSALQSRIQRYISANNPMAAQMGLAPQMSPEEASKEADAIMKQVRALRAKSKGKEVKIKGQLRVLAAQFVIMFYTMKAMSLGMNSAQMNEALPGAGPPMPPQPPTITTELLLEFKAAQADDMILAWQLLDSKSLTGNMAKAAVVLKVDVAQRLEDAEKLATVFRELTSRSLDPQELMVAFTAAPFLCDWKATANLARRVKKQCGSLEQFHMMSQAMPIPDYSVLYEMAESAGLFDKPTPDPKTIKWDTIEVSKIRVKFVDVQCGKFEEKRKELLEEINKSPVEWEDVPNATAVQIKRMGGFYQTVSFGDIPFSLCGPFESEGKLRVKGYTELVLDPNADPGAPPPPMPMDPSAGNYTVVVQKEEWILNEVPNEDPNAKRVWKGTYCLDQQPQASKTTNDPSNAPVVMSFELEIYEKGAVLPAPSSEQKEEVKSADPPSAEVAASGEGKAVAAKAAPAGGEEQPQAENKVESEIGAPKDAASAAPPKQATEAKEPVSVPVVVTEFDDLTLD